MTFFSVVIKTQAGLRFPFKLGSLTVCFLLVSFLGVKLKAENLCGGNIGYQFEGGLTYTFESSIWICDQLDTLHVNFHFGDGGMEQVSIPIEAAPEGFYSVNFILEYTFSSAGQYTVYITEGSLPDGLCNVPNSGAESMRIYTRLNISPFFGSNITPTLSPIWQLDDVGGWLVHDLQAFDMEGDSLSYAFVSPDIPGFSYPSDIELTIDGKIRYFPTLECEILVFVEITEWRNGIGIQSLVRSIILKGALTDIIASNRLPSVSLYPNPTTSLTTLTWQGQNQGNYQLQLYDVHGRQVLQFDGAATNGTNTLTIDMSGLAPGIYFGRLEIGEEMRSFKVVRE
jgi:hypothetical protein